MELYQYGFEQGLFMLLNLCTTIVVGVMFNMLLECIVFTIVYLPLRSNAGGYHAKSPLQCYLISTVIISIALLMVSFTAQEPLISCCMIGIGFITVFILAPVEDENKPLEAIEIQVYRGRARLILYILAIAFIVSLYLRLHNVSATIATAIILMAVMTVAGKIRKRRKPYV